jgi:hypothetical protein
MALSFPFPPCFTDTHELESLGYPSQLASSHIAKGTALSRTQAVPSPPNRFSPTWDMLGRALLFLGRYPLKQRWGYEKTILV